MTEVQKLHPQKTANTKVGLELLREPFPAHQISKLPKPTKRQTEEVRNDFKKGIRCALCGQWHHPKVEHLDYVGHAALTDRLLDCDPEWNWKPMTTDESGLPIFDQFGGMWITLTVCGVTRMGYGHPDGKTGGNAIKEVIGDALRNAAMRFGAALDLWHKGDLHADEGDDPEPEFNPRAAADRLITAINKRKGDREALAQLWTGEKQTLGELPDDLFAEVKSAFTAAAPKPAPSADLADDEIPY